MCANTVTYPCKYVNMAGDLDDFFMLSSMFIFLGKDFQTLMQKRFYILFLGS